MTFELIEPTPINPKNFWLGTRMTGAVFRRQIAQQAHQCARWLRISGFEVLSVVGGIRQPRVVIKPVPLCDALDDVVEAYERGPRGERRYRYAVRFGCVVEWGVV